MSKAQIEQFQRRTTKEGQWSQFVRQGEMILRDRNAGMLPSDMCVKYNVSLSTLYRRIDQAIAARIVPTVDAYREQQNALLDDLASQWQRQIDVADVMVEQGIQQAEASTVEKGMAARERALMGMLRVAERRAKLMGLDAPVKAEITVEDVTPNVDRRVADLAAEIKAQAGAHP